MSEASPRGSELDRLRANDRRVHEDELPNSDELIRGLRERCAEQQARIVALENANQIREGIIREAMERGNARRLDRSRLRFGVGVGSEGRSPTAHVRNLRGRVASAVRRLRDQGSR